MTTTRNRQDSEKSRRNSLELPCESESSCRQHGYLGESGCRQRGNTLELPSESESSAESDLDSPAADCSTEIENTQLLLEKLTKAVTEAEGYLYELKPMIKGLEKVFINIPAL